MAPPTQPILLLLLPLRTRITRPFPIPRPRTICSTASLSRYTTSALGTQHAIPIILEAPVYRILSNQAVSA
ncbi:hypothetical protein GQ43DRAFT_445064 [Delitschia confertaspora ATCC 74209]|uniref:Secreted protein n=1 Tax=Delitschia confertaspora ATCC 74209 TaxID=1513339 RepID=A0A9P4JBK1_9PLEO|nr:hypothetical protein GQ43DRAFT_445064 [Delitschia confertaspora ATCC 74209]